MTAVFQNQYGSIGFYILKEEEKKKGFIYEENQKFSADW